MAATSVSKALESLTVSKTKELKGVCQSSPPFCSIPTKTNLPQTEKRDALMAVETKYQRKWEEDKIFETNAPTTSEVPLHSISAAELRAKYPKFFGCIAYP